MNRIQNTLLKFILKLDRRTPTNTLQRCMRILKISHIADSCVHGFVNDVIIGMCPEIFLDYHTLSVVQWMSVSQMEVKLYVHSAIKLLRFSDCCHCSFLMMKFNKNASDRIFYHHVKTSWCWTFDITYHAGPRPGLPHVHLYIFRCWPPARWAISPLVATGSLILYTYKSKLLFFMYLYCRK